MRENKKNSYTITYLVVGTTNKEVAKNTIVVVTEASVATTITSIVTFCISSYEKTEVFLYNNIFNCCNN